MLSDENINGTANPIYAYINTTSNVNNLSKFEVEVEAEEVERDDNITSNIKLLSYFDESGDIYASYALASHALFAWQNGHELTLSDPVKSNYEPEDPRWNKIRLIWEQISLERKKLESYDCKQQGKRSKLCADRYILWLDSDLIFLDLTFDLKKILIDKFQDAELMISRETFTYNGLVNTGCLLIKVTIFMETFFQRMVERIRSSR
jgi:hypothetical protein